MNSPATRRAILYARVSTDEQAQGYSLRYQEEQLRRFCEIKTIEAVAFYRDDASAKTFARPEFQKLLQFIRANKGLIDTLLVVKWDRFSRNTADSYAMIRELNKLGISVEAVEQPLDLSSPEQKLMLALYLAQPEVENDRRSLNTRSGMRRAMREGRWVSGAPLGYSNVGKEKGKTSIIPNQDAQLIQRAFTLVATTASPIEVIRKRLYRDGLTVSKSHFFRILRNPAYAGKILIPEWGKEAAEIVPGLHEALVSQSLFDEVQEKLQGKVRRRANTSKKASLFPLRGTMLCNRCGRSLTASTSKGNGGKYSYYHCDRQCGERHRSQRVEEALMQYLTEFQIKPEVRMLYSHILSDVHRTHSKQRRESSKRIEAQIEEYENRLTKAAEKLIEDGIDKESYDRLRSSYTRKLTDLKLELSLVKESQDELLEQFNKGINLLTNLSSRYDSANLDQKQRILGSVFPGKLVFDGKIFRTNRLNDVLSLISNDLNELQKAKTGHTANSASMSRVVTPTGLEPVQPP
jgi:site-specific DNA recombinase